MKILYHHRIRSKDGQYVHVEELINALRQQNHEVIVVGPSAVEEEDFGADAGLVAQMKRRLPGAVYELLEFLYAFGDFMRLAGAIRRHQPDVLYERYNLYLPSGVWAKRIFGLPMLLEVNAPLYAERGKYDGLSLRWLAKWTERFAWRGADMVLPVTRVLAQYVIAEGVPEPRIEVIPNGANLQRFEQAPKREVAKTALGLHDKTVLGFVGFMRDWHGLEDIVDMVADSKDPTRHFLVVGDGPARASVEARAAERGIAGQVTVTGIVDRDRVADYIAAFDVALQPDVVAYASPLKLFEYLALGCAIVAPATDNIREILTDCSNALLFEAGDVTALTAATERLCEDDELRGRLGVAARQTIFEQQLLWSANASKVAAMFVDLRERNAVTA